MKMKTLFISLSNRAVFRNLFFFPESLFMYLVPWVKNHTDHRLVVIVEAREYEKYKSVLLPHLSERVILEGVKVPNASGVIGRLFYFFYSYLIYTGTTKLLATMAMRSDEPPAGGKSYLAVFKWLIARTFGRSRWFKRKVVPVFFNLIFRKNPFTYLFDRYQPNLIFISHLYGWADQMLLSESTRNGVKTFGMAAGWDHLDKYYLPFHVDRLIAQSEEIKRSAIRYQAYREEDTVITGYPHFDFIADSKNIISREEITKYLNIPPSARFVLYISGSAYCPDEPDIIKELLSWFEEGVFGHDVYLIVRPYSGGRSLDKEFDKRKYFQFKNHRLARFFDEDLWGDVSKSRFFINIIRYSSVIIGMYTTLILEASVLDRPLLAAAFDGHRKLPINRSIRRFERMEHFRDVLKTGALPTAYDFETLRVLLKTYFNDSVAYGVERTRLRQELCGQLDGHSSERIASIIFKELL